MHGSQAVYCTTELCLSVDKLEKKNNNREGTMLVYRGQLLKTENTYTLVRLEALFKSPQSSPFVPSRIRSPSFLARACVRNPSRCFVKRSAVLFFVSTRLTDRRFSHIHCCIAKHRISVCLSPPGPLRCRMCLADSESISRRTETL